MQLLSNVYSLTGKFPPKEAYGLTNQLQRAAVSIPSNIAEGMGRFSIKERMHFLEISNGSIMEVMCQLEIAQLLGYITTEELQEQERKVAILAKMMIGLRNKLEDKDNV